MQKLAVLALCSVLSIVAAEPDWLNGTSTRRSGDPAVIRGPGVIQWRTFGAAAFAEAARLNKPVFLFVTANWNPRGKTMERVTFPDLAIATRLNDEFIPVRLNREERPDLDLRLQQAVRALGGGNGLPLSVFLTPQGRAFYGGTFFFAEDDPLSERPGLAAVIHRLAQAWKAGGDLSTRAAELDAALRKANAGEATRADLEKINTDALLASAQNLLAVHALAAAPQGGGLFPAPRAIEFCLAHHARTGDKRSLQMAASTLNAMLRGGIYDQLDGGFYRSSTDPLWIVPRFEKLLAPNAEMAAVCLHVWQKTADERCKRAVEATLDFWLGLREHGGVFFHGSQAGGGSDLDDGEFATWSVKDIERALRDDTDCRLAKLVFDIQETGDLPASLPARNVLYEALSLEDAAKRLQMPASDAAKRWQLIRDQLRRTRLARPAPTVDKNIYIDGNALMAAAFLEAGHAMKQPEWTAQGQKTLRAVLLKGIEREPSGALHVLPPEGKPASAMRLAQDEASILYACAVAFETTSDPFFIQQAEAALKRLDEKFWDRMHGGYFDRAADAPLETEGLAWRTKGCHDTSEASPNGLAAAACLKLSAAGGRPEFALKARSIVEAFGGALEPQGPYAATLGAAACLLKTAPPAR